MKNLDGSGVYVFVLEKTYHYEGSEVLGVYSTLEKARKTAIDAMQDSYGGVFPEIKTNEWEEGLVTLHISTWPVL